MPEKARVFMAEDDPECRMFTKMFVEDSGHQIVLQAITLAEALQCIQQFHEFNIQVALIDGNLDDPKDISGSDGHKLAEAIKQFAPEVKRVGISSKDVMGVDINVHKSRIPSELGRIITNL